MVSWLFFEVDSLKSWLIQHCERTANFDYDALDRLKKADYTANVQTPNPAIGQTAQYVENSDLNTYGYDSVGNRINETNKAQSKTITLTSDNNGQTARQEQVTTSPEQATTATFNELNELTRLNEPNGISNFTYDDNGNLAQISKNSTVISKYEYDVRNQLTKAKDGLDNELARFDYDFERKRIGKTNSTETTNYVYAGSQIVNETQNSSSSASYTIGAGEIVKSEFSTGENNFHFTDALGSITSLADARGSLTSRNEYNAFGELSTSGNSSNSIGYTGQRLDNETGLMALGNGERYYSPTYARFIQQDSWLGNNQMPQSMNRFSYVSNNPLTYTDPTGREGLVANQLREQVQNGVANTGNENLDWWINFGANFVTGYNYDAINFLSLGTLGAIDVIAQDAVNGKATGFGDAWMRNGYSASTTQIAANFVNYGAGVGNGVKNIAVGLPTLAYGLATDTGGTLNKMHAGLAEQVGSLVDTAADPRGALDKLAQHSQENIAYGVGEFVGETVAMEGVGALVGKGIGITGRVLGETRVGSAVAKVFTEAGSKVSAVRQGIRSFESKALGKASESTFDFVEGGRGNRFLGGKFATAADNKADPK